LNLIVAAGLVAAIGDVRRFASSEELVSYVGLNPRVRQSGLGLAQHGRIKKQGRSHARAMLVEAAWAAAKAPGPLLRSFFLRIRARRGIQVAAVAVGAKAGRLVLASAEQGGRLSVDAARPGGEQSTRNGVAGRRTGQERQQARSGECVECDGAARP
jgi:hypothetical protein